MMSVGVKIYESKSEEQVINFEIALCCPVALLVLFPNDTSPVYCCQVDIGEGSLCNHRQHKRCYSKLDLNPYREKCNKNG